MGPRDGRGLAQVHRAEHPRRPLPRPRRPHPLPPPRSLRRPPLRRPLHHRPFPAPPPHPPPRPRPGRRHVPLPRAHARRRPRPPHGGGHPEREPPAAHRGGGAVGVRAAPGAAGGLDAIPPGDADPVRAAVGASGSRREGGAPLRRAVHPEQREGARGRRADLPLPRGRGFRRGHRRPLNMDGVFLRRFKKVPSLP